MLNPGSARSENATAEPPPAAATQTAAVPPSTQPDIADLILTLTGEDDIQTKKAAAVTILENDLADNAERLITLFERKNEISAKMAICQAIAATKSQDPRYAPHLLRFLQQPDQLLQREAGRALAHYNDPSVQASLQSHRGRLLSEALKTNMKALFDLSPEAAQTTLLLRWLQSMVPAERETALEIMHDGLNKNIKPANGVLEKVRSMLDDSDPLVRQRIVELLRDIRVPADAPLLRTMLAKGQPGEVRATIYHALGLLQDPAAIADCIAGLNDPDEAVAARAAEALSLLGQLASGVTDQVRREAAEALIQRINLPIQNPTLRENIITAMSRIGDGPALPVLAGFAGPDEPAATIRKAAIRGLGRIGNAEHIPLLIDRLENDPDPGTREAAAEALARLGSKIEHLKPLRDRLDAKNEKSPLVTKAAWTAYRQLFTGLPADEQQAILDSWTGQDAAIATARADLLTDLDHLLTTSAPSERVRLAEIREQLGDALVLANQLNEAVGAYARAAEAAFGDQPDRRLRIATKHIDISLRIPSPENAITFAALAKLPEVRAAIAERLLRYAEETAQSNPESAREFLARLKASIPDQFGPEWAQRFDQILIPATQPASVPAAG
ncbi:MAG: HEAT repeat domain-containing protein [Phycisphaerales bacterium]|nr:HEAT repeat domain-containing protein [Phycisphaerales bacterium]